MSISPEAVKPVEPQVVEHHDASTEFVVDETLKNTGIQTVQKNFQSQIADTQGKPIIQTPPTQVISISPPADTTVLTAQSQGDVSDASTWFAKFWLRIITKALHFGWSIMGR